MTEPVDKPDGESVADPKPKKVPNPTGKGGFRPGNNANPHGRKGKAGRRPSSYGEPAGDMRLPSMERAMLLVMSQPEEDDKTAWEFEARTWLKKDRRSFLERTAEIQRAMPPGGTCLGTTPEGTAAPAADLGTERCVRLCETLLEQWAAEDAAKANAR